jgi:glycosyltransferase involved in cell wall biosynthesis
MATLPTVSVVIPNYNYARFLTERFRSILDQSFQNYEIIFLDDASTDESVSLVKAQFGSRIARFEINATNSGNPFVQWNRGVRLSRGEYVWIAEADDVCAPDFLERLFQSMSGNASVGLAYCNTVPIDGVGKAVDDGFYLRYVSDLDPLRWLNDFTASGLAEVRDYLARKNTITNVSGVLFRRDAYVRAGGAPETLRMCGDWMTYCRVLHESDVAYVSAPLNFHRQHPTKHTQNSVLNLTYFREFLQVQEYVAQAFNLRGDERQAAFHRFLGEWDRLTVSNYGRIGLSGTLRLAQMAAKSYPGLGCHARVAGHLLLNCAKSLAGKWLIH